MKHKYELSIDIPQGIECHYHDGELKCKKGVDEVARKINLTGVEVKVHDGKILFNSHKANKKDISYIKATAAHVKNMFLGLENEFTYELEVCFVHFPITIKVDGNKMIINNFLGEKVSRVAHIPENVKVNVNGQKITVSATNIERAGQAAANIERATKIAKRDRRVFQDGIFITSKPTKE